MVRGALRWWRGSCAARPGRCGQWRPWPERRTSLRQLRAAFQAMSEAGRCPACRRGGTRACGGQMPGPSRGQPGTTTSKDMATARDSATPSGGSAWDPPRLSGSGRVTARPLGTPGTAHCPTGGPDQPEDAAASGTGVRAAEAMEHVTAWDALRSETRAPHDRKRGLSRDVGGRHLCTGTARRAGLRPPGRIYPKPLRTAAWGHLSNVVDCVCACVYACMYACMHARVRACVCGGAIVLTPWETRFLT